MRTVFAGAVATRMGMAVRHAVERKRGREDREGNAIDSRCVVSAAANFAHPDARIAW